jgi:hypothetical protein
MGRLTENSQIISFETSVHWKHKLSRFGCTTDTALKVITLPDMTPCLLVWFYWPSGKNPIFFFIFTLIHHYVTNGISDIISPVSFHSHKNRSLKTNLLTKLFQEAEDSERGIFGTDTKLIYIFLLVILYRHAFTPLCLAVFVPRVYICVRLLSLFKLTTSVPKVIVV